MSARFTTRGRDYFTSPDQHGRRDGSRYSSADSFVRTAGWFTPAMFTLSAAILLSSCIVGKA